MQAVEAQIETGASAGWAWQQIIEERVNELKKVDDPLKMYLADIYTVAVNLAGIPGISVPCGFDDAGLPIGLQILTPAFSEAKLLRIARMHEARTDWHAKRPTIGE